jgi:hypothetical protein
VSKVPEGFGLVCHRAIRTICEVVGIKDIYAKIEGPTNLQHIVKAFFLGLLRQVGHIVNYAKFAPYQRSQFIVYCSKSVSKLSLLACLFFLNQIIRDFFFDVVENHGLVVNFSKHEYKTPASNGEWEYFSTIISCTVFRKLSLPQ